MWEWIVRLFASSYEPLNRPRLPSSVCGSTIDSPDMQHVRDIQHDADNMLTSIRGNRQMEERAARLRILEKQANPRGIGDDE